MNTAELTEEVKALRALVKIMLDNVRGLYERVKELERRV